MNHDLIVNEINFDKSLIHRILSCFSVNNSIVLGNTFIMDSYLSAGWQYSTFGPGSEHFACQNSGLSQIFKQIVSASEKMLNDINVFK